MELFASLPCEPIPEDAGNHYVRIKRETERRGTRLDETDLWIAATSVSLGAILVTRDSDFQRVSGLKMDNWLYLAASGLSPYNQWIVAPYPNGSCCLVPTA